MALKNICRLDIGTTRVTVGNMIGSNLVRTLIGLRCTNQKLDQPITAEVYIRKEAGEYYPIMSGVLIPAGGGVEALASSKIVLVTGDTLYARSSVDASLTIIASFDEDTP